MQEKKEEKEKQELYTKGSTGEYRLAREVIPNCKMYVKENGEFQLVDWQKKEIRCQEITTILSNIDYKTEEERNFAIEKFVESNLSMKEIQFIISPLLQQQQPKSSSSRPGVL
jgi:hypothetical protein